MSKLPSVSWKDVVRVLEKLGFVYDRQKGSHLVFYHPVSNATVIVPKHAAIKKGTLSQVLRQANLTRDEFVKLIK